MPTDAQGTFRQRVEHVRSSWEERRELSRMSPVGDRASRFSLLLWIYGWVAQASEVINEVYDYSLGLVLSPTPLAADECPAFSVHLSGRALSFSLAPLDPADPSRWVVSAVSGENESPGEEYRGRRPVRWSRRRVEDLLLNLLAEHERSLRLDVG